MTNTFFSKNKKWNVCNEPLSMDHKLLLELPIRLYICNL